MDYISGSSVCITSIWFINDVCMFEMDNARVDYEFGVQGQKLPQNGVLMQILV